MRRKPSSYHIWSRALFYETCEEIVTNRWFDVVAFYKLHREGK